MSDKTKEQAAIDAANLLAQLYVLGAVRDILEGGSGNGIECAPRIIKLCDTEAKKLLAKYDKKIAEVSK